MISSFKRTPTHWFIPAISNDEASGTRAKDGDSNGKRERLIQTVKVVKKIPSKSIAVIDERLCEREIVMKQRERERERERAYELDVKEKEHRRETKWIK
jgi:hypothetical protein